MSDELDGAEERRRRDRDPDRYKRAMAEHERQRRNEAIETAAIQLMLGRLADLTGHSADPTILLCLGAFRDDPGNRDEFVEFLKGLAGA